MAILTRYIDVYKRQVKYEVLEPVLDFHKAKDNPILVHPEENWKSLCPVGAAVSYTHLDVYKRQVLHWRRCGRVGGRQN